MTFRRMLIGVVGLLLLYATLAWTYVRNCSPTYDEPLHLVASYVIRHAGDLRVNPEDPPLWQRWVGLGLKDGAVRPEFGSQAWQEMPENLLTHTVWSGDAMYGEKNRGVVDAASALASARRQMLLVSLLAGVTTGLLAWVLGGQLGLSRPARGWAVLIATAMFALDPTVLAHGALVKNDVAILLCFALTSLAVMRVGEKATVGRILLVGLGIALGVTTKFSGLVLLPIVTILLVIRAALPGAWEVVGRPLAGKLAKLGAAVGIVCVCLLMAWGAVWAVYGFRFEVAAGGPAAAIEKDWVTVKANLAIQRSTVHGGEARLSADEVPVVAKGVRWLYEKRLMPSVWCKGFLFTYATTQLRDSFLLSELSDVGWRGYFPLAVAFKEPLGMLVLVGIGAGIGGWTLVRMRSEWRKDQSVAVRRLFAVATVMVPVAVYGASAIAGHMNAGIRHLLPIYPMVAAGVAVGLAGTWWMRKTVGRVAVGVLLVGVAAETLVSRDRLIAFFNVPARMYGPERLLADSNLDWGQDIPKLVAWQKAHPEVELAGLLWGQATPESYGLKFVPVAGTERTWGTPVELPKRGVFAVSATWLQEMYLPEDLWGSLAIWRFQKPREVLGGTIFLYDLPATPGNLQPPERRWRLYEKTAEGRVALPLRPKRGAGGGPGGSGENAK